MEHRLTLTINGEIVHLQDISPTMTLLEYLRLSGRVGTKEGCGDGDCGACTVAIIASGADGQFHYQAMNSCLIPLGSVAGREIVTVEGLANGKVTSGSLASGSLASGSLASSNSPAEALHPVQAAMVKTGGSQCGYCTPGFIMSLFAAYYDGKVDDVAVEGNLCRCTGYLPIRQAAKLVASQLVESPSVNSDPFRDRLSQPCLDPPPQPYRKHDQQFYHPARLTELFDLLQHHPNATLVAGATDLGLELSSHSRAFPVMISLERVAELEELIITPEQVEIGAAVPLSHIEMNLRGIFPSLDEMIYWFAARQVRNRATIGGNIGTASPIGDLPPVLLALDAQVRLASAAGDRVVALADFFKGYRQTDLQPGEVIQTVIISRTLTPGATRRLSQSYKVGKRGTDDISIVAAAFTVDLDDQDWVVHARLAYGGVAATPARAIAVEQQLLGQPWNSNTVQATKAALKDAFTPLTDLRGSAEYRKLLVANLFEKFFVEMPFNSGNG
jgi:xanthine dehydrogenase small subunit